MLVKVEMIGGGVVRVSGRGCDRWFPLAPTFAGHGDLKVGDAVWARFDRKAARFVRSGWDTV